jgi:hypothetical protein
MLPLIFHLENENYLCRVPKTQYNQVGNMEGWLLGTHAQCGAVEKTAPEPGGFPLLPFTFSVSIDTSAILFVPVSHP